MAIDTKAQNGGTRRMHIYVNETADKIIRSECEKSGITITDYVVSAALSFRADEPSKKLDVTLGKLKKYMNENDIKYSQRRCNNGKKRKKC